MAKKKGPAKKRVSRRSVRKKPTTKKKTWRDVVDETLERIEHDPEGAVELAQNAAETAKALHGAIKEHPEETKRFLRNIAISAAAKMVRGR